MENYLQYVLMGLYVLAVVVVIIVSVARFIKRKKKNGEAVKAVDIVEEVAQNIAKLETMFPVANSGFIKNNFVQSKIESFCEKNSIKYDPEQFNKMVAVLVDLMNYYKKEHAPEEEADIKPTPETMNHVTPAIKFSDMEIESVITDSAAHALLEANGNCAHFSKSLWNGKPYYFIRYNRNGISVEVRGADLAKLKIEFLEEFEKAVIKSTRKENK